MTGARGWGGKHLVERVAQHGSRRDRDDNVSAATRDALRCGEQPTGGAGRSSKSQGLEEICPAADASEPSRGQRQQRHLGTARQNQLGLDASPQPQSGDEACHVGEQAELASHQHDVNPVDAAVQGRRLGPGGDHRVHCLAVGSGLREDVAGHEIDLLGDRGRDDSGARTDGIGHREYGLPVRNEERVASAYRRVIGRGVEARPRCRHWGQREPRRPQ